MTSTTRAGCSPRLRLGSAGRGRSLRSEPGATLAASASVAGVHTGPWVARLREAIAHRRFVLHYQPIVSLHSGEIADGGVCCYEALLRLADRPDGELVGPGSFLPAAERCGLVREIDSLVLGEAIALLGAELARRRTPVAVNLSGLSVTADGTLPLIEGLLGRHRVEPARLIVEVTESAAISDMDRACRFCTGLRQLGCGVALDDFGSGFSSFRYLKRLPFDYLKIDGDFVAALRSSREDQLVVQALVRVARGMGKRTIAEYVGDQETIELLRAYGVDHGQGFGIGRPRDAVEIFAAAA
ncbi:MAG: EAL domain-containing protein [Solirubrobacteraceae bacterium]